MKRTLTALGLLVLTVTVGRGAVAEPSDLDHARTCISAADWATLVHDKSSGVAINVLADINGVEAKQVVDRVNAEPPETHLAADHVIVLGAKVVETDVPAPYVLVAFFNHGCLVASGRAPPEGVADMLEGEST